MKPLLVMEKTGAISFKDSVRAVIASIRWKCVTNRFYRWRTCGRSSYLSTHALGARALNLSTDRADNLQRVAEGINRVRSNRIDQCARAKGSLNHSSEYTPARAFEIISIMADGYSVTAAAAKMGAHRDKINEWAKQHPEFADAVKRGKSFRVWKLETDLLRARNGTVVRARIFMLEHAGCVEYRDKDIDHPIENPLQMLKEQLVAMHSGR